MKTISLAAASVFLSLTLSAQECGTGRYTDPNFFPQVSSTLGVTYGNNVSVDGINQVLKLDIYEPTGDVLALRPVVFVAFGGSFITGSRADVASFCIALAKRGYVAVAMDYRVGFFFPNTSTTYHAVMRCVHDMKGSIRYLRQTIAMDGNPYRLDTDRFIVGGVSAGAIGAVHLTYMNEPSELPGPLVADSTALGGMEGTSGPSGYSSDVAACFSLSGAIGDTSWMRPGDQPLMAIHETGDAIVPCFTQEAYALGFPTGISVSGGHDMHERMQHINVPTCYLEYPGSQHVGYLTYDPVNSTNALVDFLAKLTCGENPGCPATLLTGVEDKGLEPQPVRLYPTPTDGPLHIELAEATVVTITDMEGRKVMQRALPSGTSTLNISFLGDGSYILCTQGARPFAARVMKVR